MNSAASIFADPTNHVLSDLPFAHSRARARCHDAIRRAFNAPFDEPENNARSVFLHLGTLNGPILLEMEASVLASGGEGAERYVVLTGREVNADLASLVATSRSDGTLAGANEDNERAETTSTIVSELTESGLGDNQSHHNDEAAHDDGNHYPTTAAVAATAVVFAADRGIVHMAGLARRRNYASSSGSSSFVTPTNPFAPVTRRTSEFARLQLERRQQIASNIVQRAWRLHRPAILYPRSWNLVFMAMRANPIGVGSFEEILHLIAVFISGVVPSALALSQQYVRRTP